MATEFKKKRISEKTLRAIFCTAFYGVLALFVAGLFLFDAFYCRIYDSPEVESGTVDMGGVDLPSRDVACNLAGEWEFFYNKWIVTDGYNGEPDGMIDLPGLWTYKKIGSKRLPRSGYASYRLIARGVQPEVYVFVYRHYAYCAYRVFINGSLNFVSGTVSKDENETHISGKTDGKTPYLTDGGDLEIVIEVSASATGGLNAAPWLAATSTGNSYGNGLRAFNYIALGITSAAVVVSVLASLFFKYKRDFSVPAFMAALWAHFMTSRDMFYVFHMPIAAALILQLMTALACFALLILHFKRMGVKLSKRYVLSISIAAAVLTILLAAFFGTPLAPWFGLVLLAVGASNLVPLLFDAKMSVMRRAVYGALFSFLTAVFLFEMCDGLGLLVFGTEFIFTYLLMTIVACFAVLWLWKIERSAMDAIRVGELECELSSVKNKALKAQIEPHFVYNSLTAIQARYRDGLNEGDAAVEQFSKYLRLVTDSDGEDTVPFDDEVKNILNYFELENLRVGGKLELILDLDYTDFRVPVLSLQPFVENAVKHARLTEKRDGCITLSSFKTDSFVVVEVSDNGCGFDTATARCGVGLKNAQKRFELFNAQMNIESAPDRGTKITVTIPLERS